MPKTVLLRVAYDGTDFHGFARQPGLRTVQGVLEGALGRLCGRPVPIRGASRTDAGVHAKGALVGFLAPGPIPAENYQRALAPWLPADLAVGEGWFADHPERPGALVDPRHFNLGKRYRYTIIERARRDPFEDRWAWRWPAGALDVAAMRAGAAALIGEHDFASFRGQDCQARSTVRLIRSIDIRAQPGAGDDGASRRVEFDVEGSAFLKQMVRIVVGTLVEVGRGAREPGWVSAALQARARAAAGPTAPACGLTLLEVHWPATWPPPTAGRTHR